MADSPNYKETTVAGTAWQRACRMVLENQYQTVPSLVFVEEELMAMESGRIVREACTNIYVTFDPANPLHVELDTVLRAIYAEECDKRDNPPVTPEP